MPNLVPEATYWQAKLWQADKKEKFSLFNLTCGHSLGIRVSTKRLFGLKKL